MRIFCNADTKRVGGNTREAWSAHGKTRGPKPKIKENVEVRTGAQQGREEER